MIEPYGLLNHGGGWYVLGKSRTHREDRVFVFQLERIRSVAVLDGQLRAARRLRPAQVPGRPHVHRRPGAGPGDVAPARAGRPPSGTAVQAGAPGTGWGDGRPVSGLPNGWLAAWVLRQGREVEVLSPPGLAAWVAELARRVSAAHASADVSAETSVGDQEA